MKDIIFSCLKQCKQGGSWITSLTYQKKNCQPRILYSAKISSKNQRQNKDIFRHPEAEWIYQETHYKKS